MEAVRERGAEWIGPHELDADSNIGRRIPMAISHDRANPERYLYGSSAAFDLVFTYSAHQWSLRRTADRQKTAAEMSPIGDEDAPFTIASADAWFSTKSK